MNEMLPSKPEVVVTDVRMPFLSMVVFMIKWAVAAVPALLFLAVASALAWVFLAGLVTSPAHRPSASSSQATSLLPPTPLAGFTLAGPALVMPVEGARTLDLRDSFEEKRGGPRQHEAIDILAPRGTLVLAAMDGSIEKLFTSKQGG